MISILQFFLTLVGCIVLGDLLAPVATYLFYKSVNLMRALLLKMSLTRSITNYIAYYTSDDINAIYPPKTIQYLRRYLHLHHREQTIKPAHMIKEFKQTGNEVLFKNSSNMVECPIIESYDDKPKKPCHLKRIISKGKSDNNQNGTLPYARVVLTIAIWLS